MALDDVLERVRDVADGGTIVILAGPGVAAAGPAGIAGLRDFAAATGVGVLNTWGLKGIFEWQSPYHLGTVGLQERDFEMAGLGDADLILGIGIDTHEAPPDRWQLAPHVRLAPRQLRELAARWPRAPATPIRPPLYERLAEVIGPLYSADKVPLSPARAVADLEAALPEGGVVFADPGPAGLWVARSFPTSTLGSVHVPAVEEPGFAAWSAVHIARGGRPAVAVTRDPYDLATDEALAFAATEGVPFVLCVWGAGSLDSAGDHRARLVDALDADHVRVVEVPIDWTDTDLLYEVAGGVIAWT